MRKKRLIDATDLVRRVLEERDKVSLTVIPRYNFGVPEPCRHGQAMRGGIRKALREIETSPTIDAVEVVRCKECVYRDQAFRCIALYYGFNPHDDWFCANGKKDAEVKGCSDIS